MITTVTTMAVKDFDTWQRHFAEGRAAREEAGIRLTAVYRSVQDPNSVTLVADVESMDVMQKFMGNPEIQATIQASGVQGPPSVLMLQRVAVAEAALV